VVTIGAAANGDSAVSHRHAWRTLVPYKKKPVPKDEPKVDDPNKGADGGKGGVPLGEGGRPNKGVPNPYGEGAGTLNANLSKHGLVLDRYLEVTSESRKLPVSLVLIVDPDLVNLVQARLVDSPLRFLTTQVAIQRSQVSLRPAEPGGKLGEGEPGPGTPPFKGSPGVPKFGGGGVFGSMPQPPGSFGADLPAVAGDDPENVELTVYGIVTLYERPGRPVIAPADEKK